MGVTAFNRAWELLDLAERRPEQDDEMLAATFAQRHHWYAAGDARNRAIADWQVSRVAAFLELVDLARRFGERSLEGCLGHERDPFVTGYAHEAIARAMRLTGDGEELARHRATGLAGRRLLLDDLESL